jgi:flagellar biosynthetic protein FlhB
MADPSKTEKATPKRQREARQKGQVAKSTELNGALVMLAGLIGVTLFGSTVVDNAATTMQSTWGLIAHPSDVSSAAGLHGLEQLVAHVMEVTVGPIAGLVLAVGLMANIGQVGLRPSFHAIKPSFSKINPMAGFKSLFGPRAAVETVKALAKIAVVGSVVAMALVPMLTNLGASIGTTPFALGSLLSSSAKSIMMRVVVAYLLIAAVDLIYQRRKFAKQMRMTKQEVKDEGKATELPPEIKSAIRRRQILAARARMMAAIPGADVVVTNPTHYAVALRYDGTKPAPIVVAKGKNLIAAQIRHIAEENKIPIIPDPPLARSLHAMVEIDQMIPAELYAAVAQVLAYVYKMAGKRRVPVAS